MSKRITLTDIEAEYILKEVEDDLKYCGSSVMERRSLEALQAKLKSQHPRSVETLGVSGDGDTPESIPRKKAS